MCPNCVAPNSRSSAKRKHDNKKVSKYLIPNHYVVYPSISLSKINTYPSGGDENLRFVNTFPSLGRTGCQEKKDYSSTWLVWITLTVPRKEITLKMIIVNHRSLPWRLSSLADGVNYLAHLDLIYIFVHLVALLISTTIDNPTLRRKSDRYLWTWRLYQTGGISARVPELSPCKPIFLDVVFVHTILGVGETKTAPSGAFLETFKEIKDTGVGLSGHRYGSIYAKLVDNMSD